jgi:hypothetical protein
MQDSLSGRAAELVHLTDLIRTSLSLGDVAIPLINEQLNGLAEMGIDNLELEGPRIYSRTAGWSPAFDDEQIIYAAALTMPGGLGCTTWSADEYAMRYGAPTMSRRPCGSDSSRTTSFRQSCGQ